MSQQITNQVETALQAVRLVYERLTTGRGVSAWGDITTPFPGVVTMKPVVPGLGTTEATWVGVKTDDGYATISVTYMWPGRFPRPVVVTWSQGLIPSKGIGLPREVALVTHKAAIALDQAIHAIASVDRAPYAVYEELCEKGGIIPTMYATTSLQGDEIYCLTYRGGKLEINLELDAWTYEVRRINVIVAQKLYHYTLNDGQHIVNREVHRLESSD